MSVFAIADLHLSHSVNKSMEVFRGWDNYVERIKNNWSKVVTADDTVVIAGDVSWGMSMEQSLLDFKFINELSGNKIILKGNHDYWWQTKSKMDKFLSENELDTIKILHNNSFDVDGISICGTRGWIYDGTEPFDKKIIDREAGRLSLSIESAKKSGLPIVCFLHYPPVYVNEVCQEILDVLKQNCIKHCFYGHIHGAGSAYAYKGDYEGIKMSLISADFLNFTPKKVIVGSTC